MGDWCIPELQSSHKTTLQGNLLRSSADTLVYPGDPPKISQSAQLIEGWQAL